MEEDKKVHHCALQVAFVLLRQRAQVRSVGTKSLRPNSPRTPFGLQKSLFHFHRLQFDCVCKCCVVSKEALAQSLSLALGVWSTNCDLQVKIDSRGTVRPGWRVLHK